MHVDSSPYTLEWTAPFPLKIAPYHGDLDRSSNTWFLESTHVHSPNGSSIGSAVFPGLTIVTDIPTDQATPSVTIGRIYVYVVL